MAKSVDPDVPPSGTGCVECLAARGWWLHLRRCAECGHIGCCDNSPSQHATAHAQSSASRVTVGFPRVSQLSSIPRLGRGGGRRAP
jgi:hypothetical protein